MTIDTYSYCPCGSGKKIKFCKCKDSVGELDRVLKMIEGGQMVAALDRLNQILEDHPSAAWALSVRGRLLLDLREFSTLAENAERFVRLQPSNPIALAQKAAAQIFSGDLKQGTETLLQGLAETGQGVDSFVLDVASVLSFAQGQARWLLTAQMYALLTISAQGYSEQTSSQTMHMIQGSPSVNLLIKSPPRLRDRPADVGWGERYDEAAGLLLNQRMLLAEPKLESLDRQNPGEPTILTGLLMCAVWRGDVERQCQLFKKLSACEALDLEERARMLALSGLADPEERPLCVKGAVLTYEVENADQLMMECEAHARFLSVPAEMLQPPLAEEADEWVPPRVGYQILDGDPPTGTDVPQADEIPEVLGVAFFFGRQTDRAPHLDVHVRDHARAQVEQLLAELTAVGSLAEEVEQVEPLLSELQPELPFLQVRGTQAAMGTLERQLLNDRLVQRALQVRLPITDFKSLEEIASDEAYRLQRTAVIRVLQNYDSLMMAAGEQLEVLAERLNVEKLPQIKATRDSIDDLENHDLARLDVSESDAETALHILQRAKQVFCSPAVMAASNRLIELEPEGEMKQAKLFAFMSKVPLLRSPEKAMAVLKEAKTWAEANAQSTAPLLLAILPQQLMSADAEGFQSTMQELTGKYGNDPAVMGRLQQMLVQVGLVNPDGTPRMTRPAAQAPAAGGLWTPDQGPATAPPAGAQPAEGGSKLWIPGMD